MRYKRLHHGVYLKIDLFGRIFWTKELDMFQGLGLCLFSWYTILMLGLVFFYEGFYGGWKV